MEESKRRIKEDVDLYSFVHGNNRYDTFIYVIWEIVYNDTFNC